MPEMVTIQHEKRGKVLLLRVVGRLDAVSATPAEQKLLALIDKEEPKVLLDFTGVNYLSSAGMRMLFAIFKRCRDASGKLAVCSVDDGVMDVLKISGFDGVLDVFPTQDEALRSF